MRRAFFTADAAAYALLIIDYGKVVHNRNCALGAVPCAKPAANTACRAFFANRSAFFAVRAGNYHPGNIREKLNDMVRTGLCAKSASNAFSGIDVGYAVFNADSILRADGGAVAKAEASVRTHTLAAVKHLSGAAGGDPLINMLLLMVVAIAGTMHECDLLDDVLALDSENVGNLFCHGVRTGNAQVRFYAFLLGKRLCITVTAGKAACAAVGAGEALADGYLLFVDGNSHKMGSNGKHHRAYKPDGCN